MCKHVLIVEDDVAFATMIASYLSKQGYTVTRAATVSDAKGILKEKNIHLLITDIQLPHGTGMDLLHYVREKIKSTNVVLMTSYADVSTAVSAIKLGALDYISKPFRSEELLMIVEQSFENSNGNIATTLSNNQSPNSKPKALFVEGFSEVSKKLKQHLHLVGPTDMCVLIEGQSGTGKEVAAHTIHKTSNRAKENFIAVDCGAIPKEIAASEFFGHIKGSFTGAVTDKKGHFEVAHKGTLFLDEVGNLSYENQIQLLRALQERKIKPVGGTEEIEVDVRIISATNENLKKAVANGDFREDLYHRLNEFSIKIPSLNERKEDLFLFVAYFLEQANKALNKNVLGLSKEVKTAFINYNWPGNLRELKNIIKRSVLLTEGNYITIDAIPREVIISKIVEKTKDFSKESNEKLLIKNALNATNNNKSKAARLLNITRKTLYNKIEQYDIEL